jgi:hypothetical protein
MAFIVEMARGRPDDEDFQTFTMDVWTWKIMLEFGKKNGWKQAGTLPDEYAASYPEYMNYFKNDYEPNEWSLCKAFDAMDALGLAKALKLGVQRALDGKIPPPIRKWTQSP